MEWFDSPVNTNKRIWLQPWFQGGVKWISPIQPALEKKLFAENKTASIHPLQPTGRALHLLPVPRPEGTRRNHKQPLGACAPFLGGRNGPFPGPKKRAWCTGVLGLGVQKKKSCCRGNSFLENFYASAGGWRGLELVQGILARSEHKAHGPKVKYLCCVDLGLDVIVPFFSSLTTKGT